MTTSHRLPQQSCCAGAYKERSLGWNVVGGLRREPDLGPVLEGSVTGGRVGGLRLTAVADCSPLRVVPPGRLAAALDRIAALCLAAAWGCAERRGRLEPGSVRKSWWDRSLDREERQVPVDAFLGRLCAGGNGTSPPPPLPSTRRLRGHPYAFLVFVVITIDMRPCIGQQRSGPCIGDHGWARGVLRLRVGASAYLAGFSHMWLEIGT